MEKAGLHAFVSGRVQGVWFRKNTQEQAEIHGLVGWVRNLPDGRVEVKAFGPIESIQTLETWLSKGPRLANVIHLESNAIDYEEEHTGFIITG
jgi:acylphosphatase